MRAKRHAFFCAKKLNFYTEGLSKKCIFANGIKIEKLGYEKNIYTPVGYGGCSG